MNKDGSFMEFDTGNCVLSGKALLDELEKIVRQGHSAPENSHRKAKRQRLYVVSLVRKTFTAFRQRKDVFV